MLYPQNGDRIVAIDTVTLLYPLYRCRIECIEGPTRRRGLLLQACHVRGLFVCVLGKTVSAAKAGKPTRMPFAETRTRVHCGDWQRFIIMLHRLHDFIGENVTLASSIAVAPFCAGLRASLRAC